MYYVIKYYRKFTLSIFGLWLEYKTIKFYRESRWNGNGSVGMQSHSTAVNGRIRNEILDFLPERANKQRNVGIAEYRNEKNHVP